MLMNQRVESQVWWMLGDSELEECLTRICEMQQNVMSVIRCCNTNNKDIGVLASLKAVQRNSIQMQGDSQFE